MIAEGKRGDDGILDQYPGSDLSISELRDALTTKLDQARNSRDRIPLPLVRSTGNGLSVTVASLRRIINRHDSWTHRLPPEMLAAVASYLEDDASLVVATHVCYLWRTALLASPHLWSHLGFASQRRALAFLERSKSVPLRVDLEGAGIPSEVAMESLSRIAPRITALQGEDTLFLQKLLRHSVPAMRTLVVSRVVGKITPVIIFKDFPSLTSVVISGEGAVPFYAPHLTTFHFTYRTGSHFPHKVDGQLLYIIGNSPLLEVVSLYYGETRMDIDPATEEFFSPPRLRSFTHDSSHDRYHLALFNQLSLPSTCRVAFVIDAVPNCLHTWGPVVSAIRDPSYLGIKRIRIGIHEDPTAYTRLRLELVRSGNAITSFDMRFYPSPGRPNYSPDFLDFLGKIRNSSIETACFHRFFQSREPVTSIMIREHISRELQKLRNLKTLILSQCVLAPFLDVLLPCERWCPTIEMLVIHSNRMSAPYPYEYDLVDRVQEIARLRSEAGFRLKALILVLRDTGESSGPLERLKERRVELEQLRDCVGWLKVVTGDEALSWDVDKDFLGNHDGILSKLNI